MQQTMLAGIAMWSVWQPDRNLYFNSFFVAMPDGNVAIDPLPLSETDAAEIASRGGLAWVLITNRDHERDARAVATRFGARLVSSEREAPLLSGPVDRTLKPGESFADAVVIALEGVKTPGEIALWWQARSTVLVGDALWGSPAGAVRLMPDDKLGDPARAVLSLRALRACRPEHLLVGDGACIFGGADRAIWTCLEARRDAYVNRINRDEVAPKSWDDEPPGYGGTTLEIGDYIGAEKLGYRLVEIPPGHASCPLHWHASEEELFVVLKGAPTLLTPRGDLDLREGDYVSFPTRAEGAHKLTNRTETTCEVLMLANVDPGDVCYYPDSHKVLIERSDVLVRDNPVLAYWEGE
ncbi:MAG: cupin domain-containing protein [Candidatus Eremiobacteraeota bacterium]|nr:cupin domain-containing protein [Candidatus Eremiobacteraeota bacterium]